MLVLTGAGAKKRRGAFDMMVGKFNILIKLFNVVVALHFGTRGANAIS